MRIALAQSDVAFGDVVANLERLRERVDAAARGGAELVVFPECFLTGYAFASPAEVRRVALEVPGPETRELERRLDPHQRPLLPRRRPDRARSEGRRRALLQHGAADRARRRRAALPQAPPAGARLRPLRRAGRSASRRRDDAARAHRPLDLLRRQLSGDGARAEAPRRATRRAPTNWPEQATVSRRFQSMVRAFENHAELRRVQPDRERRGFQSPAAARRSISAGGRRAGRRSRRAALRRLDLARADDNRIVHVAGEYEQLDRIAHRRPEHYGALVEPARPRAST
jgi:hypothetical protein